MRFVNASLSGRGPGSGRVIRFPQDGRREADYPDRVRFGVLGTLTVVDDAGVRRLGGPARRRLLAALLARAGRTVSVDALIEDLWDDAPPATAEKTLQSHVVRLRDALGRDDDGSPLRTDPTGYRLDVAAECVDAWCFERDAEGGRRLLVGGDPAGALAQLDQALSWWRGEAYAEFPDAGFAVTERLRLAELHALTAEARTDAALALGAAAELVPQLEVRLRDDPFRERSWEQLLLSLYRSGRQADALTAYRRAQTLLDDELGLAPSVALRDLERRILTQDPSLDIGATAALLRQPEGHTFPVRWTRWRVPRRGIPTASPTPRGCPCHRCPRPPVRTRVWRRTTRPMRLRSSVGNGSPRSSPAVWWTTT